MGYENLDIYSNVLNWLTVKVLYLVYQIYQSLLKVKRIFLGIL